MAVKPNKRELEKLKEILEGMDDKSSGPDGAEIIKHARKAGGIRKGVRSFFDEKNMQSAVKTGFGSSVKTAASWIFNDTTSDVLSALFDKKYNKKEIDAFKKKMGKDGKDPTGKDGISKKDVDKGFADVNKAIEGVKQYMSKTVSKTQTVSKKFKEVGDQIDEIKDDIKEDIEGLQDYMSKTLSKTQNVSKKFKETGEMITDGFEGVTEELSDLKDSIKEMMENMGEKGDKSEEESSKVNVEILGKIGLIEKRVNAKGRVYYHDTGAKQHVSKEQYIAQQEGRRIPTNGSVSIAQTIVGLKKSVEKISKEEKSAKKISNKILESVTHEKAKEKDKDKDSIGKGAKEKGVTVTKVSTDIMSLKPEPDTHFLSPEFTFLEADEQERITRDALKEAFEDLKKDNPELFNGGNQKGIIEELMDKGFSKIAGKFFGGARNGLKAVGQGVSKAGGGIVKATKNIIGKGSAVLKGGAAAAEGAAKPLAKVGAKTAETALKKGGGDVAKKVTALISKNSGKILGKSLAGAGILFGAWDMFKHASKGDWTGMALDATAIAGSTAELTGVGAAVGAPAAILASVTNVIRDGYSDIFGMPPEQDPNFKANMNQATEVASNWVKNKLGMEAKKEEKKPPAAAAAAPGTPPSAKPTPSAAPAATNTTPAKPAAPAPAPPPAPVPPAPKPAAPTPSGDDWAVGTSGQKMTQELKSAILKMPDEDARQAIGAFKVLTDPNASATAKMGAGEMLDKLTAKVKQPQLKPATPNPVGQNIIQGNQQNESMKATPPPAPAATATKQKVTVTNNTMLPPEKTGPKMEVSKSENTMNRLQAHDTDNPWAAINR